MKVYAVDRFLLWLVTFPLRPLFIPLALYLLLIGRVNLWKVNLRQVSTIALFVVHLPVRLLILPITLPLALLFGEMQID